MTSPKSSSGKRRERNGVLKAIAASHKSKIALLSLVSLASALSEALFIVLITAVAMAAVAGDDIVGPVFDRVLPIRDALVLAAVSLVSRAALSLWVVSISARLAALVTTAQRRRLSHAYLRASWAIQQAEPAGRLQELLTSFVARISATVTTFSTAITAGLSLIAFLGTGMVLDPMSAALVIVALAVIAAMLTPLRRAIRRRSVTNLQASLRFANAVSELGSLGLEMQTYGVENRFEDRIDDLTEISAHTQRRTQELQGSQPVVYMSLAYGAVLAGIATLTLAGSPDLGAIGAVILLMLRSISYGQTLANAAAAIAGYLPFLEGVEDTVERYLDKPSTHASRRPQAVAPLQAVDAAFAYAPERTVLSGVNFTLKPGEALGVIGPSGAGKSTLAQLLFGLRTPTGGEIRAAGVPLDQIDHRWWTCRAAFVAQDANLFTGTVAENIRFFRDGISDADLREAARRANVLTDIQALPQGFDTHLGERGSQLSGGQRQRLSIARALAGKPELLILDEPTSALDGQSEVLIRDSLATLHGQLTVIIIAHRLSTLDICDRIMVIEAGRMTAIGTPAALVVDNDFYRNALDVAGLTKD